VRVTVGPGARLFFLPEPIVAAARCRHHNTSTVDLAAGAGLIWREEAVFGRHGEAAGDLRLSTTIRRDARPWYCSDVAVGPAHPDGPAILAGARVLATLVTTSDKFDIPDVSPTAAVMALARGGLVATALGADLAQTRRMTDRLVTSPQ
jgi:urease accessory protein